MTVGIVLIKGLPGRHEHTFKFLMDMKKKGTLEKKKSVRIREVYFSMGWPDIILLLEAKQVLDIHEAITFVTNKLKNRKEEYRDFIDTSTIICSKKIRKEIEKEIVKYSAKFVL